MSSGIKKATQNRAIKEMLVATLKRMGFWVKWTEDAQITVFTNMPINYNSQKISRAYDFPYATSFTKEKAEKFIRENN